MKKNYNSSDVHPTQGQELSKKLYRSISEHAKRLDDARGCTRNVADLFTSNLRIQRRKLCDYCERLIFSEPLLYGRKIEELLWRKGFYDVVSTAKKLKKKEFLPEETSNILAHINAGVGFYHHFLSRLQNEHDVNLRNVIDFPLTTVSNDGKKSEESAEMTEYINHAIHQCLIYLGDLNRYKLEIYPNWEPTIAIRYYSQAVSFRPECGMPHNQMGTLAMTQNLFLDAVYHYMRCLTCSVPFEGTTNNLQSLFERNSKYLEEIPDDKRNGSVVQANKYDVTKYFLARFLLLIDIWYFDKVIPRVFSLCHQTFRDLEKCLSYMKSSSSDSGDSPIESESADTDSSSSSSVLTNNMLFKIVTICLLCITKLQAQHSSHLSTVIAFTLAIYSQLIEHVTNHIRESVLNYPLPEPDAIPKTSKRNKSQLRRRKALQVDSEESDASDNDENNADSGSSSDESFMSDVEDILANSSDEDTELHKNSLNDSHEKTATPRPADGKNTVTNNTPEINEKSAEEIISKAKRMEVNDMLEIMSEEGSLAIIKILNDWLIHDSEVLKSCGQSTRSMFRQITLLLNLININIKSSKVSGLTVNVADVLTTETHIPLPEDITLKGLEILKSTQDKLDWSYVNKYSTNSKDETVIRITKLLAFGKTLTSFKDLEVVYKNKVFSCHLNENEETQPNVLMEELDAQDDSENNKVLDVPEQDAEAKGLSKMKHMGQLWLAAEVRALESRVKGKASLSPYLVLDTDALIQYTYMVKHLVHSRKFIVIVPSAVVSVLDDLKREKLEARDAIRWLETQFHRGNRFFRAQRPQEKASIPFIKYPKKKDKEMFVYIQIIECCYYLAQQQKDASNLVTLLIGNQTVLINGENKEFSYVGLAKSAGIAIEAITQFYGKWKKSYKGKR